MDSRNSGSFDKTNRNEDGKGSVKSTKKSSDKYCAKLKDVTFVGMIDEFGDENEKNESEARRGLIYERFDGDEKVQIDSMNDAMHEDEEAKIMSGLRGNI